jgi:hypothetical protein
MAAYPALVQTAWDIVETFLKQWTREPYRWNNEIDAQVAIAGRLTAACDLIGRGTLLGGYQNLLPPRPQVWSRVSCEPKVYYKNADDERRHCFPDIVIWDDIPDPEHPPDADGHGFWPILWACEIKYIQSEDAGVWDLEKMQYLVKQERARYGCWVHMRREVGKGVIWTKEMDQRFWRCEATVEQDR